MNKRIDELAREAAGGMLSYDEDGYRLSEREVKKFAELIIQECVGRVRYCIQHDLDYIAEDIEQHFGVDE